MPHGQMHEAEWAERIQHHKFMSNTEDTRISNSSGTSSR